MLGESSRPISFRSKRDRHAGSVQVPAWPRYEVEMVSQDTFRSWRFSVGAAGFLSKGNSVWGFCAEWACSDHWTQEYPSSRAFSSMRAKAVRSQGVISRVAFPIESIHTRRCRFDATIREIIRAWRSGRIANVLERGGPVLADHGSRADLPQLLWLKDWTRVSASTSTCIGQKTAFVGPRMGFGADSGSVRKVRSLGSRRPRDLLGCGVFRA